MHFSCMCSSTEAQDTVRAKELRTLRKMGRNKILYLKYVGSTFRSTCAMGTAATWLLDGAHIMRLRYIRITSYTICICYVQCEHKPHNNNNNHEQQQHRIRYALKTLIFFWMCACVLIARTLDVFLFQFYFQKK